MWFVKITFVLLYKFRCGIMVKISNLRKARMIWLCWKNMLDLSVDPLNLE